MADRLAQFPNFPGRQLKHCLPAFLQAYWRSIVLAALERAREVCLHDFIAVRKDEQETADSFGSGQADERV